MAEPIGYVPLQIIPSLDGLSKEMDKQLGGKLKVAGKQGGKALAKGVGEGLKDLEREVESAAKAYDKLRDRAADATGKIRVEEEKLARARQSGRSDAITAAEERLSKARRDSARATQDAERGHSTLIASQRRLRDSSDDTSTGLSRMSGIATAAGSALGTAVAGGAALAVTGIAALAAGVVVAGNRLYELGGQFDDLNDTLQIKTGQSGAALDKLSDSVKKLGTTNTPSSFAEIGDIAVEVTRNLHATGPEFDGLTSRLANLNRMGQSVDIRSLGKAFRGFGVDAKDQVPALNSLYEASTKSGLSIDDMLSAMQKSGPALRQFGFGFGEAAALAGTFEEAGLDGEKAMAALNKAFAYFTKEGIPAEQGLRDIVTRIRELGDTPEAGELATKVFGAKGGAGFLEAIQNGTLDLESLQDSLRTTGLDINQVSDDTADWSEKWQDLKNELAVTLEPVASGLFEGINAELADAADAVVENKGVIIDSAVGIGNATITLAEVSIKSLGMLSEGWGQLIAPIGDTLGAIMKALSYTVIGNDELKNSLREDSEILFGLEEDMTAFGRSVKGVDFSDLRDSVSQMGEAAKTATDKNDDLDSSIGDVGSSAGTSAGDVDKLRQSLEELGKVGPMPWLAPPGTPGVPGGSTPGQNPLDPSVLVPGGLPAGIRPGGGGQGAGLNLQIAAASGVPGGKYGLPAGTNTGGYGTGTSSTFPDWVMQVADAFGIKPSTYPGHQESNRNEPGYAPNPQGQNRGIDWSGPVENMQRFADYLATVPGSLEQVIFQNPSTGRSTEIAGGRPQPGYFSGDLAGHRDHVHTRQSAPIPLPSGAGFSPASASSSSSSSLWDEIAQAESSGAWNDNNSGGHSTSSGAPRGGLQITDGTWRDYGGTEFAPTANLATKEQQIKVAERIAFTGYNGKQPQGLAAWQVITEGKTPNVTTSTPQSAFMASNTTSVASSSGVNGSSALTNAFGAEYEAGIGTPGYDEYGEPGYYEVDPRKVQDVQDRIADQNERIRQADEAARQAQVAIDDLDVDADQAEKDAAIERKRTADYAAGVARRELDRLQEDLGEAQQGDFSPAKKAPKSSTRGGDRESGFSMPSTLSGFGSAIGEFVGGQVGSGLEVFGINDSPGWLKGLSTLIGGISVTDDAGNAIFDGGNMFSGASPNSASPATFGIPPPIEGNAHGTRAGQAPGVVYNIRTATVEDAFLQARRRENERAATPLARF